MSFKEKYLKYKKKYLDLKGGLRTMPEGVNEGHSLFNKFFNLHINSTRVINQDSFIELLFASGFDINFHQNPEYRKLLGLLNDYNAIYVIDFANYYNRYKDVEIDENLKSKLLNIEKKNNELTQKKDIFEYVQNKLSIFEKPDMTDFMINDGDSKKLKKLVNSDINSDINSVFITLIKESIIYSINNMLQSNLIELVELLNKYDENFKDSKSII